MTAHSASPVDTASLHVLIVDGARTPREALRELIAPLVCKVLTAESGETGLAHCRTDQPDVVFVAERLHGVDGLDFCAQARETYGDLALIVTTAQADVGLLDRIIRQGIDGYLATPWQAAEVFAALQRCARRREQTIERKLAQMVFEVANEGIVVADEQTRVLAVNPAFTVLTGYRPRDIVGQPTRVLASGRHGREFYRAMWDALRHHGRWSGELTNRRRDGSFYEEWLSIVAVNGEGRRPERYVGLISDITERKREEERIRRLAHFDSLTSLPNRVLFEDRLQRAIARARRYRHQLAVLYLDLDHFKDVNDTLGHAAGDEVLRQTAHRMLLCLRQIDTVSRRGGDEFVLLIEEHEGVDALQGICAKLQEEIVRPIEVGGHTIRIGASIGIAIYPDDALLPEELLAAADTALYEAKADGRGRFRFFSPGSLPGGTRFDMERELRDGLANWRYSLLYLPEISMETGRVEYVEALLRFQHPVYGLLDAGRFLEIAESIGIMPELGRRALAEAAAELKGMAGEFGLVVDLSSQQLSDPAAVTHLLDTLTEVGVPPARITFECTELALSSSPQALETLTRLSAAGCRFSLDDFGAGYCSFSLLAQLSMDTIKIDRSFVAEIVGSRAMHELVAALVAFGRRLGARVVAEGVETPTQLALLRAMGCDAAQGFLFGPPADFETMRDCTGVMERIFSPPVRTDAESDACPSRASGKAD